MNSSASVDLSGAIDRAPVRAFQYGVFALCFLCLLADGFDAQALGYVVPAMSREWGIPPAAFSPAFSIGLIGMAIGAPFLGALADYAGRRRIIVFCTAVVGASTFAMSTVARLPELMALRFVAGLALGGLIPNALSLAAEYSPARRRSVVVMITSCGISLGSALGGIVAGVVIHAQGWAAVFRFGGLLSIALTVITLMLMPESIRYRALHAPNGRGFARLVQRVCPELRIDASTRFTVSEERASGLTVRHLFSERRAGQTLLLWVIYFMCLLQIYFFASWLPTVLTRSGVTMQASVFATSALQIAGTVAALTLGGTLERRNPGRVLTVLYLIGAVGILAIGMSLSSPWLLVLATACAGFGIVGAQAGTHALASRTYPTFMRATGMGWGLGIGRIGSVIGPLVGGTLLASNWPAQSLLSIGTVPALLAAVAAWTLARRLASASVAGQSGPGGFTHDADPAAPSTTATAAAATTATQDLSVQLGGQSR